MTPSAVVLVVDYLNPGQLGPYGAAEPRTPAFNRFASRALVADLCFTDSPRIRHAYQGFWRGIPACAPTVSAAVDSRPPPPLHSGILLPKLANQRGMRSLLITDGGEASLSPDSDAFAKHYVWEADPPTQLADSIETTRLARYTRFALEKLQELGPDPGLVWIHVHSLGDCWDAPYELREALVDDSDPPPSRLHQPPLPGSILTEDPDDLLPLRVAYAAQVAVLDACLEQFLPTLEEHVERPSTLCLLTAPRGMPLGLHGAVGPDGGTLYEESLHVPLLIASSEHRRNPARASRFFSPRHIHHILAAWLAGDPPYADTEEPEGLAACDGEELSWRTPCWYFKTDRTALAATSPEDSGDHRDDDGRMEAHEELYAKPDDRWEMNEISRRCPDAVEDCRAALRGLIVVPGKE